jgi:hypothetical protein
MIQRISEDLLWCQIVARAWCDEGFMERLRAEPRAVLAEHGLEVPPATEIQVEEGNEAQVVEDSDAVRRFILPGSPPEELMDEDLAGDAVAWCYCAASGGCWRCAGCWRCGCRCRCW